MSMIILLLRIWYVRRYQGRFYVYVVDQANLQPTQQRTRDFLCIQIPLFHDYFIFCQKHHWQHQPQPPSKGNLLAPFSESMVPCTVLQNFARIYSTFIFVTFIKEASLSRQRHLPVLSQSAPRTCIQAFFSPFLPAS